MSEDLVLRAAAYVDALCSVRPDRHVGSAGNAAAVDLFERVAGGFGWRLRSTPFDCVEWEAGDSSVTVDGRRVPLCTGPYSLPTETTAPLAAASTVDEIEQTDFAGKILALHGPVAREQLMPKNFEFYNPASHKRVIAALEARPPAAIIAVTTRNPDLAGAVYPFPLIEDADFDVPNAFVSDADGEPLLACVGRPATVRIDSARIPARGRQLVARKPGTGVGRVVIFAHIDGRKGIPAALDNASGTGALLVLAELLADHSGSLAVELVPINGEDYYGACGQIVWIRENETRLEDIVLGMNADDVGHVGARTGVSLYGCPPRVESVVRGLIAEREAFLEGPQWPQGDHSIFAMNGVPAIAFTAEDFMETYRTITHTPKDRPELVDPAILVEVASFMAEAIARLS